MGKLIKNFLYNGTYNMLIMILPLIITPYLTRTLGSNALGVEGYVVSIVSLVKLFGALGINLYCNREVAYHRDNKEELTKTYYELQRIRFTLGIVVTAFYIVIASRTQYGLYFMIETFALVGYFIDVTWLFIGREEMKLPVLRNIVVKLIQTALIFLLVKSPEDLSIYLWISVIGTFVGSVCMYTQVGKYIGKYDSKQLEIKKHLKPILALFLPQAASSIYVQFDRTMIGWLSEDISYVSIYDKAENLVKLPIYFVGALSSAMMPRVSNEFANKNFDKIKGLLKNELKFVFLFLLPMVVGMVVIADNLVLWYLGSEYVESALVIRILVPIVFAKAMGEVLSTQLLISVNDTKGMTIAFSCGAIFNLVANALLIPKFNAAGAAIGTVIAEIVVVIIQYNFAKKYIGKLEVMGTLGKKIIGSLIMLLAIVPLGTLFDGFWMMMLQIGVGAIVYFVILYVCKDAELKVALDMITKKKKKDA